MAESSRRRAAGDPDLLFLFEMSGYRKAARDFINACTEAGGTVVQSSHRTPMQCFDPAGNLIPIY